MKNLIKCSILMFAMSMLSCSTDDTQTKNTPIEQAAKPQIGEMSVDRPQPIILVMPAPPALQNPYAQNTSNGSTSYVIICHTPYAYSSGKFLVQDTSTGAISTIYWSDEGDMSHDPELGYGGGVGAIYYHAPYKGVMRYYMSFLNPYGTASDCNDF